MAERLRLRITVGQKRYSCLTQYLGLARDLFILDPSQPEGSCSAAASDGTSNKGGSAGSMRGRGETQSAGSSSWSGGELPVQDTTGVGDSSAAGGVEEGLGSGGEGGASGLQQRVIMPPERRAADGQAGCEGGNVVRVVER